MNVGDALPEPTEGLLTTVAWQLPAATLGAGDGLVTHYALEGAIFVTGAAIQWLRDGLGIIDDASAVGPLAESVDGTDGVVVVPAFTGLGAAVLGPLRPGHRPRHHPGNRPRPPRPCRGRVDGVPDPGRGRCHGVGVGNLVERAAGRRRSGGHGAAVAAPGRSARRCRDQGRRDRDDRARSRLPRRPRRRDLVDRGRARIDVSAPRPGSSRPPTASDADRSHAQWSRAVERARAWV